MKKGGFRVENKNFFSKDRFAFTLVEMVVVVMIIIILATIAFLRLWNYSSEANLAKRASDKKNIEEVLDVYKLKNGEYPEFDEENGEKIFWPIAWGKVKTNLPELPIDPITKKYYKIDFIATWKYGRNAFVDLWDNKKDIFYKWEVEIPTVWITSPYSKLKIDLTGRRIWEAVLYTPWDITSYDGHIWIPKRNWSISIIVWKEIEAIEYIAKQGSTIIKYKPKISPEYNPEPKNPDNSDNGWNINRYTIWVDENGKPLKPEKPGTHEPGNIPGYRLITTVTKDGVTIHKFEKRKPVDPNNPVPQTPTSPNPTPQPLSNLYEPIWKIQYVNNWSIPVPAASIENINSLPEWVTYKWKEFNIDTRRPGTKELIVVVTYPDNSIDEVTVQIHIMSEEEPSMSETPKLTKIEHSQITGELSIKVTTLDWRYYPKNSKIKLNWHSYVVEDLWIIKIPNDDLPDTMGFYKAIATELGKSPKAANSDIELPARLVPSVEATIIKTNYSSIIKTDDNWVVKYPEEVEIPTVWILWEYDKPMLSIVWKQIWDIVSYTPQDITNYEGVVYTPKNKWSFDFRIGGEPHIVEYIRKKATGTVDVPSSGITDKYRYSWAPDYPIISESPVLRNGDRDETTWSTTFLIEQ